MSDHFGTLCIKGLSAVPRLYWNTTTASISWFFTAFHIFTIFLLYRLFSVCLLIRLVFKSCEESRKNNLRLNYIVLLRIIRLESFKLQPHKIEKHIQTIGRLLRTNCLSVFDHFVELVLNPIQDGPFRGCSRMGGKKVPHPKICHTYPAIMKLGIIIPYLKKIQKIYESLDTFLESCWHQHFFTGNQQILIFQEIQI